MKKWIIGVDEVGRGPVAGPVSVCVCAISFSLYRKNIWDGLTDSKKMSPKKRELWYKKAKEFEKDEGIRFSVISRNALLIDKKGIQSALRECITEGFEKIAISPKDSEVYLDGGLTAPKKYVRQTTLIKGDSKEKSISLASVIAKVVRDNYMSRIAKKYPEYGFEKHKGYGTKNHYNVILKKGITPLHRKSFLLSIKK